MTFVSRQYSLADFYKITNDGIKYTLDTTVINIIQELTNQVGAPEYVRTPQFDENTSNHVKRYGRHVRQDNTKIGVIPERPLKEGVNIYMDTIRKLLNKITTKTYSELFPTLIEELDKIVVLQEEYKTTISTLVLSIVSETSFYSVMYAELYASLLERYEFLRKELDIRVVTFKKSIDEISYYSPDTEYDAFCKNNKENLKRKSIGIFLVNLVKLKAINVEQVCELIEYIQNNINEKIDDKTKTEIITEMSEISGDMIIAGKTILNVSKKWKNVINNVKSLSNMNTSDHKSLSNKTIFKCMDVLDIIG